MNYKIIADSAANLYSLGEIPFAYVPLKVCCEDREFIDNAEQGIDPMIEFLRRTKERSFTSCPNMQDWLETFGDAEEIYVVAIQEISSRRSYENIVSTLLCSALIRYTCRNCSSSAS